MARGYSPFSHHHSPPSSLQPTGTHLQREPKLSPQNLSPPLPQRVQLSLSLQQLSVLPDGGASREGLVQVVEKRRELVENCFLPGWVQTNLALLHMTAEREGDITPRVLSNVYTSMKDTCMCSVLYSFRVLCPKQLVFLGIMLTSSQLC